MSKKIKLSIELEVEVQTDSMFLDAEKWDQLGNYMIDEFVENVNNTMDEKLVVGKRIFASMELPSN